MSSHRAKAWAAVAALGMALALFPGGRVHAVSVARVWDEEILSAIRLDKPHPPAHARNLFHLSVAMWDAWAVYDGVGVGYVHRERATAADVEAARREAISYAAYRILTNRYSLSSSSNVTVPALTSRLRSLGYDPAVVSEEGSAPSAVGNRVAGALMGFTLGDGSNQGGAYADPSYSAVNQPLVVKDPGTVAVDPNRWQPLALDLALTQTGQVADKIQSFLGAVWHGCRPFSLTRPGADGPWITVGAPPVLGGDTDGRYKEEFLDVVRYSGRLGPSDPATIDISPGAYGNNPLGSNAGRGHPVNPVTGAPYAANVVRRADFGRVLAEFWADGPNSETPPGHWNFLANQVADHPAMVRRLAGAGPVLGELEWDVKVYFALNAAVHDAACAAWTIKRFTDSARPITGIRYLSQAGQSSDPARPSFHPLGMKLEPGVAELVTPESSAPGQRHASLAGAVGQVAVRAWVGEPADPTNTVGGVGWILGKNWVPYQRKTFVTPAFPGYVSGHSTFSRSAAEVLSLATGSTFFPGGLARFTAAAGKYLTFEDGPSADVTLEWATYYDAADQAGQSRIWGGIHILSDDVDGRVIGSQIGRRVWELARRYFDGSILSERVVPVAVVGNGAIALSWNSVRGFRYRVQSSRDLEAWLDETDFSRTGEAVTRFSTFAFPVGAEFYRVIPEPFR